jgi:hypothetical protein
VTGLVTTTYLVYLSNGDVCEKQIETDCHAQEPSCCAEVGFKLKPKWPNWNNMNGTFSITNLDPFSPICSVEISSSPAGTFSTGTLIVDGLVSGQAWTSTNIPGTGSLSPAAVNTIQFDLMASGYKGAVTICVVKCDGTRCCFDFKWNKNPWTDIGVSVDDLAIPGKLGILSISPKVDTDFEGKVKYVSFGFRDENEIAIYQPAFFAVSGAKYDGDENPDEDAAISHSYMGKNNVFFELAEAKPAGGSLGNFNMVIANHLPKLGCSLFDEEGNQVFAAEIDVDGDTLSTSLAALGTSDNLFEFINLYPNPTDGRFEITYATGDYKKVAIKVIDNTGQVVLQKQGRAGYAGIHKETLENNRLSGGVYHVVLISEDGKTRSKSYVKK